MWKQEPTMECTRCKEIEYVHVDTEVFEDHKTLEYNCRSCGEFGFFDEKSTRGLLADIGENLVKVCEERDRLREVIMALEDWQHQLWGGGSKTLRQISEDSTWQELREFQEWRNDL